MQMRIDFITTSMIRHHLSEFRRFKKLDMIRMNSCSNITYMLFSAHIFGSGAPEEWLILASDIVMVRFLRICPASLGPSVLPVSWFNKYCFHARQKNPIDDGDNFHVNHHTLHVKNMGNAYPYDLLMGTSMKEMVKWAGYEIHREETKDGKSYRLCFVYLRNSEELKASKRPSLSMSGVEFVSSS